LYYIVRLSLSWSIVSTQSLLLLNSKLQSICLSLYILALHIPLEYIGCLLSLVNNTNNIISSTTTYCPSSFIHTKMNGIDCLANLNDNLKSIRSIAKISKKQGNY